MESVRFRASKDRPGKTTDLAYHLSYRVGKVRQGIVPPCPVCIQCLINGDSCQSYIAISTLAPVEEPLLTCSKISSNGGSLESVCRLHFAKSRTTIASNACLQRYLSGCPARNAIKDSQRGDKPKMHCYLTPRLLNRAAAWSGPIAQDYSTI